MDLNIFIFGFSIIIFILGAVLVYLSSKEFQKMVDEDAPEKAEFTGRAVLADRFIKLFTETEDEITLRKRKQIEQILEDEES